VRSARSAPLTFVIVYELGQESLAKLMQERPSIAEEISVTPGAGGPRPVRQGRAPTATRRRAGRRRGWSIRIRLLFELPRV